MIERQIITETLCPHRCYKLPQVESLSSSGEGAIVHRHMTVAICTELEAVAGEGMTEVKGTITICKDGTDRSTLLEASFKKLGLQLGLGLLLQSL